MCYSCTTEPVVAVVKQFFLGLFVYFAGIAYMHRIFMICTVHRHYICVLCVMKRINSEAHSKQTADFEFCFDRRHNPYYTYSLIQ